MNTDISKAIIQNKLESVDKLNRFEQGSRPKVSIDNSATVKFIDDGSDRLGSKTTTPGSAIKLKSSDLVKIKESDVIEKGKKILQKGAYANVIVEACHEYHRNEPISTRFVVLSTQHEGFFDISFSAEFDNEFILHILHEITASLKQVVNTRPMCSTLSLTANEKYITIHGKESDSFVDVELNSANFNLVLKRMIQEQRRTQVSVSKRRGG
ncbi:MAG TPA: hypothetical protein DD638_13075 [Pasteurellaceae bacterium]|nr:hypothetical protein [Pasteurellaceae bacterium]